jgi:hypothetical protein
LFPGVLKFTQSLKELFPGVLKFTQSLKELFSGVLRSTQPLKELFPQVWNRSTTAIPISPPILGSLISLILTDLPDYLVKNHLSRFVGLLPSAKSGEISVISDPERGEVSDFRAAA